MKKAVKYVVIEDLVAVDPSIALKLSEKEIFVGNEVSKDIKALGLTPSSSQLSWFYDSVKKFHVTAFKYMIKYFSKSLRSPIMNNFSALGQSKRSHVLTGRKLKYLVSMYSKIVDNIDSMDGMDKIQAEIDNYQTDDDLYMFDDDLEFTEFWKK